jgi:hypothetical protein
MSGTSQGDVGFAVISSLGECNQVVKLEALAGRATPSFAIAKGARLLIAGPYRPLDRVGNAARGGSRVSLARGLARRRCGGEARALEVAKQQGHRAVEHCREVAIRDLMAQ